MQRLRKAATRAKTKASEALMGDEAEKPKEPEPKKPGKWKRFLTAALEYGLEAIYNAKKSR